MKRIAKSIRKNPNQKVKVVIGKKDDLCDNCPYWYEDKCVQSKQIGKWVVSQDKKVAKYLLEGYWLDMGKISDYEKAQNDFKEGKIKA